MKTNNIISTPDITGNIGSCEVKATTEQIGNSFLKEQHQTVFVNSCSGEVISKDVYTGYGGVWMVIVIGFVLLVAIISNL